MTIFHVYKTDCLGASRVMLQSDWEGHRSGFIHLARDDRAPDTRLQLRYGLSSILWVLKNASERRPVCLVFHAQSALPLLFATYLLRKIIGGGRYATLVYDIHDLHDHEPYGSAFARIRYGILRYYPLRWFERWAVSRHDIRTMTVSDGLARTIVDWYGCVPPIVVYSAMQPRHSAKALASISRDPRALLFFGTAERLPFELIEDIGRAGFELHLYGRFNGRAGIERKLGRSVPDYVKVFGEYSPDDLDFIGRYRFLLIYKPDDLRANFRFSLPNKFFQSIGYGTSLILSSNFEEMAFIASAVPAGCGVLYNVNELASMMDDLDADRGEEYWQKIVALGNALHDDSRRRYLAITSTQEC